MTGFFLEEYNGLNAILFIETSVIVDLRFLERDGHGNFCIQLCYCGPNENPPFKLNILLLEVSTVGHLIDD